MGGLNVYTYYVIRMSNQMAANVSDKDKCLEPMFGDAGQAQQQLGYTKLLIAATPSRTCTIPTVGC